MKQLADIKKTIKDEHENMCNQSVGSMLTKTVNSNPDHSTTGEASNTELEDTKQKST